jgi:DNA-binding SARP family transcriptional activator
MHELRLTLLGNPEVERDGASLAGLQATKTQALLYYLAVTGRPHQRATLVGLLWPDMPEANARNNLSKALTQLRQAVGDHLVITRQEIAFDRQSPYWLDVERFERAVAAQPVRAQRASPRSDAEPGAKGQPDIEALAHAVDLYRGDFLEGLYVRQALAFEEWMLAQRARLRALALQALHMLAAQYAGQGEAGRAAGIEMTTRLLALEPWREEAHRQLMALLARSGQRGTALAQYEACRQALAEELGVKPGEETKRLYEQIRDGTLIVPPIRKTHQSKQALELSKAASSRQAQAHDQIHRGQAFRERGDYTKARSCFERAADLYRELGNREREAYALVQLGSICTRQGDHATAQVYLEQALQFYHKTRMQWGKAAVLELLSLIFRGKGEYTRSMMHAYSALCIYRQVGHQQGQDYPLTHIDEIDAFRYFEPPISLRSPAPATSDELLSQDERIPKGMHQEPIPSDDTSIPLAIARSLIVLASALICRRGTNDAAVKCLEDCFAVCRSAGLRNELGIALALRGWVGGPPSVTGKVYTRRPFLCEALQIGIESQSLEPILYALPGFAQHLAAHGKSELAIQIDALASRHYSTVANASWLERLTGGMVPLAATLPLEVVAQARNNGRARDLWATAEELLAEWCKQVWLFS